MTYAPLPANPFVAAGMITDPRLFVGRQDELQAILSRMIGAQPTSINIYGDKRIGKSSLLYNFFLTWEQRVQNPNQYVVIYLSLRDVQCQTQERLYQAIAQEFLKSPTIFNNPNLANPLQSNLDIASFSQAIKNFKQAGILPVLCLDDFEQLFKNNTEFNDNFYNNLRSLMDSSSLMLVIGSHKKLDFYSKKYKLTSDFFNLGHVIKLNELNQDDVKNLLRLPASTVKGATPALSMDEQSFTQQIGGNHPFLLQIAGRLVSEARQYGYDKEWVKTKFQSESKRLPSQLNSRDWQSQILWLLWDIPVNFGKFTKFIGNSVDDVSNWIVGMIIIIAPILIFIGVVKYPTILSFILDKLGIKSND
jgi:AAA+ ATPase superfamily predicted ATPase